MASNFGSEINQGFSSEDIAGNRSQDQAGNDSKPTNIHNRVTNSLFTKVNDFFGSPLRTQPSNGAEAATIPRPAPRKLPQNSKLRNISAPTSADNQPSRDYPDIEANTAASKPQRASFGVIPNSTTNTSRAHSPPMQRNERVESGARNAGARSLTVSKVNCPEKIIICIDVSKEMKSRRYLAKAGTKYSALEMVKKALALFVYNKLSLTSASANNQFALALLLDEVLWIVDFNNDFPTMLTQINALDGVHPSQESIDLSVLFTIIMEKAPPPMTQNWGEVTPPYTVRLILIYGRSHCMPFISDDTTQKKLLSSPFFFMDVVYLHEPTTSHEGGLVKEIHTALQALDERENCYVYNEAKRPTKIFDMFAQLLAHPLQRCPQIRFGYNLEPLQHEYVYDDGGDVQ